MINRHSTIDRPTDCQLVYFITTAMQMLLLLLLPLLEVQTLHCFCKRFNYAMNYVAEMPVARSVLESTAVWVLRDPSKPAA